MGKHKLIIIIDYKYSLKDIFINS